MCDLCTLLSSYQPLDSDLKFSLRATRWVMKRGESQFWTITRPCTSTPSNIKQKHRTKLSDTLNTFLSQLLWENTALVFRDSLTILLVNKNGREIYKTKFTWSFVVAVQLLNCVRLCDSVDWSAPGFSVLHYLLELAQTHVHRVGDANQPSHLLSPPSPAFNLSQHQGLFQWVSSSHQVAKVLELQLQHQSFQWTFRTDFLYDWLVWSPWNPRDSQESSPTPQFKNINSLALTLLYGPTFTTIHD